MPVVPDASIAAIRDQQQAIMECCNRLLAVIATGSNAGITECRARLSSLLHANLAEEDRVLNAPIRRLPLISRPVGYSEITQEAADLRGRYSAHVGKWNNASITRDPAGYERDVRVLVIDVKQHLQKKQRLIPGWVRIIESAEIIKLGDKQFG